MSKRKREDDASTATSDFRQQRRIVATFTQSAEKLAQAFKTARGFERQKLGRRKKNAVKEKDTKDEARIDAEVQALKTLDLAAAARHYLSKSILKIKAIATSPELPTELKHSRALPNDPATLNVHARLCKSNPVREIFPALLGDVKREFGVEDDVDAAVKKMRTRKKDFEGQVEVQVQKDKGSDSEGKDESEDGSRQVKRPKLGARGTDDDDSDAFAQFEDRLASSDGEDEEELDTRAQSRAKLLVPVSATLDEGLDDDGDISDDEEDLDLEDLERQLEQEGIARKASSNRTKAYDHVADLSLSEASGGDEFEAEEPKKAPAPKKSSFIPSLTMGGYISGSGSDIDDEIDTAPKKNRRGQRARQQIWEKKYGKGAKHLQNQKDDRGSGWDAKRGAVGNDRRAKGKGTGMNKAPLGRSRPGFSQSKDAAPVTKKKSHKDDSGPLHPSWEAAKKLKEKKAVPVAFQGKKISFD